jgi:hypothetical protein
VIRKENQTRTLLPFDKVIQAFNSKEKLCLKSGAGKLRASSHQITS